MVPDQLEVARTPEQDSEFRSLFMHEKKLVQGMSREDAWAVLDTKVSRLMMSVLALRAVRNSLTTIDGLPDEVLAEVFLLLFRDTNNRIQYNPPWFTIERVCHRWRAIALGTPKLWTLIDGRTISLFKTFLDRSKNMPLDIFQDSSSSTLRTLIEAISPHLNRARSIEFRLYRSSWDWLAGRLPLLPPAPTLEVLCLQQTTGRRVLGLDESFCLPDDIFSGQTPALRQVYLQHISIPLISSIFTGLVSLELRQQHPSVNRTIDIFLGALERCPQLKELKLDDAGPMLGDEAIEYPHPHRQVELPYLSILDVTNKPLDIAYLLAHLRIPRSCVLNLTCMLRHSDDDLSALLPHDCSALMPFSEICQLYMDIVDSTEIVIKGCAAGSSRPMFTASMSVRDGMLKPRLFLSQLGTFLPLPRLTHLEVINCAAYISKDKWHEVLARFPDLHTLTAREMWEPALYSQLLEALRMPVVGDNGVVCPHLHTLQLFGLQRNRAVEKVVECCKLRASNGAPLGALQVTGLDPADLVKLQQVAPVVCFEDI